MSKIIKNREDFIDENYYEGSSTMVPGQGVGPGLFPHATRITEKDAVQQGANGVKQDPDYENLAKMTHATYEGRPQLGDIVEDVNPDCPYYKATGKLFTVIGNKVQFIIANEGKNYAMGEVAYCEMSDLRTLKVNQMNGGSAVYESEDNGIVKGFNNFLGEAKKEKYPSFQTNIPIRYMDMLISPGYWTYMNKEIRGKGLYKNVNNNQTYSFSEDDIKYFKERLPQMEVMESELNEMKKPKSWDTMFAMNAIKAYEDGLFDPDDDKSLTKWEKDYNGGVAPKPGFETYDIIAWALATGKKPDGSKMNESTYYPYQIDDKRGEKLYDKYDKAMGDWNWVKKVDLHQSDNYEQHIPLDQFLKKSRMTIKELKELEEYGDESWSLYIDEDKNMLYINHD